MLINSVTSVLTYSKLINSVIKFSLLIYLLHANYFWLTYGKYEWLLMLKNKGVSLSAAVCFTILCYVVVTPLLSLAYTKIFDRLLNMLSEKICCLINCDI